MTAYLKKLTKLLKDNVPFASVIPVDTTDSVPQEAGSKMLVAESGLRYGTVSGGKVEKRDIAGNKQSQLPCVDNAGLAW